MVAIDPTYPLYPIACSLTTTMMFLTLSMNIVRRSWNLGVASLCLWLCLENAIIAINSIVWSDNVILKRFSWCDITSHLHVAFIVAQPLASFLISRQLYLIAKLRSPSKIIERKARCWDQAVQWSTSLILPVIFAGPIYYIIQGTRFSIVEGLGCNGGVSPSILSYLLVFWGAVIPLLSSVIIYDPKVAWTFYRHHKDVIRVLHSDGTISRSTYIRIFTIAMLNICVMLPLNVANTVSTWEDIGLAHLPFYAGWHSSHARWTPVTVTYAEVRSRGAIVFATTYIGRWLTPVCAWVVFGLFGFISASHGKPVLHTNASVVLSADSLAGGPPQVHNTRWTPLSSAHIFTLRIRVPL